MNSDRVSCWRLALGWLAACLVATLIIACGGGVGTGGTGAFASGPITGFGSIVVADIHFDESAARIDDDNGDNRQRSDLHLGTIVEVQSGEIRDGAATASQVRIVSALIGTVQSVSSSTLVVNGNKVASGQIPMTEPIIFSADETADVGIDNQTPVAEGIGIGPETRFTGKINKVTLEVSK